MGSQVMGLSTEKDARALQVECQKMGRKYIYISNANLDATFY